MLNETFSVIFKHCDLFYFSVAQLLPSNHELLSSTAIDNCSPVLKTSFIFHRAVNCFILNFFFSNAKNIPAMKMLVDRDHEWICNWRRLVAMVLQMVNQF